MRSQELFKDLRKIYILIFFPVLLIFFCFADFVYSVKENALIIKDIISQYWQLIDDGKTLTELTKFFIKGFK